VTTREEKALQLSAHNPFSVQLCCPKRKRQFGCHGQRAEALTLAGQRAAALPLRRRVAASADPPEEAQALAAIVLCETAPGQSVSGPPTALETRVSREFLTWYQRLVRFNARAALEALNARLEPLQSAIPSAARLLAAALAQAQPVPTR
jgi:hypothetical protein